MSETRKRAAKSTATAGKSYEGFTADERAAMKERGQELKAASKRSTKATPAEEEEAVLAKIAEMEGADRVLAERIHVIVRESAPTLIPRLWYGMPAYALNKKVVCFFQPATKFNARYATFGFNEDAKLDDGTMWPTAYALTELTSANEKAIATLVKRAVG